LSGQTSSPFRLDGSVALITGAASGLGRSHALALARAGANLGLVDLGDDHSDAEPGYSLSRADALEEVARSVREAGVQVTAVTGDVRRREDMDAAVTKVVAELGRLDTVVANAGVMVMARAADMAPKSWALMVDTNLTGTLHCCQAAIPTMVEQGHGRIIVISSMAALKGSSEESGYSATKAGQLGLVRSLAIELGPHNITVNAVCPGAIATNMNRGLAEIRGQDWKGLLNTWRQGQPMPVELEPVDVSNAVIFLASDAARYVTGLAIPVDAGISAV
jgi:NAD(P)-dependent dehydrogenase (short-subunit alcohol dehydrogenase family)